MLVDTPVTLGMFGYADAAKTIANGYAPGSFLWIVNNINFQYFSVLITIVSAVVMIVVSYMTAEPDYAKIKSLTFGTATAEDSGDPGQLGLARGAGLGVRPGLHPRRLPVLQRVGPFGREPGRLSGGVSGTRSETRSELSSPAPGRNL